MRHLIGLASNLDLRGRHATSDLIDMAMFRRAGTEGAINFLRQGKVPEPILSFVFDETNGIPNKIRKWLSYKLRDKMRNDGLSEPAQIDSELEAMKHDIIRIRDWTSDMLHHPGFDISHYHNIDEARASSDQWHEELTLHMDDGDPGLYMYPEHNAIDLGRGYRMVQINPQDPGMDLDNEGSLMGHCVGGDDYENKVRSGQSEIWSLRDERGYPHTTVELVDSGEDKYDVEDFLMDVDEDLDEAEAYEQAWMMYNDQGDRDRKYKIEQIQGKEDKPPIDKYRPFLQTWLKIQNNSKHIDVTEEDLLSVTPSIQLIEMVRKDPTILSKAEDHIDPGMKLELASIMIDRALQERLDPNTLTDVVFIDGVEKEPRFPALAEQVRERIVSGEPGWEKAGIFGTLMNGLSASKRDDFAMDMMSSPLPHWRISAVSELFFRLMPGGNNFGDTPEGGRFMANFLKTEMEPRVISAVLSPYRHNYYLEEKGEPQSPIPHDIVMLLPTMVARSEGRIRGGDFKDQDYDIPNVQAAALDIASRAAPHIIPNLVSMISGKTTSGDLPCQMINALKILRKNDRELYLQTMRSIQPSVRRQMMNEKPPAGRPSSYTGSETFHRHWMPDDLSALQEGRPLAPMEPAKLPLARRIYQEVDDRWPVEQMLPRDIVPEENDEVRRMRMQASFVPRMLRLSSRMDARGKHRISDRIDMAMFRRADLFGDLSTNDIEWTGRFLDISPTKHGARRVADFISQQGHQLLTQKVADTTDTTDTHEVRYDVERFWSSLNEFLASKLAYGNKDDHDLLLLWDAMCKFGETYERLMRDFPREDWYEDEDENRIYFEYKNKLSLFDMCAYYMVDYISALTKFVGHDAAAKLIGSARFRMSPKSMAAVLRGVDQDEERRTMGQDGLQRLLTEIHPRFSRMMTPGNEDLIVEFTRSADRKMLDREFSPADGFDGEDRQEMIDSVAPLANIATSIVEDPSFYANMTVAIVENKNLKRAPYSILTPAQGMASQSISQSLIELGRRGLVGPKVGLTRMEDYILKLFGDRSMKDEDIARVHEAFGGDFSWLTAGISELRKEELCLNSFAPPEEILQYISDHPQELEQLKFADGIPNIGQIRAVARQRRDEIVSEERPFIDQAIKEGIVKVSLLSETPGLIGALQGEATRIGVSAEELQRYANRVIVYDIDFPRYQSLCEDYKKDSKTIMGIDLRNVSGKFLSNAENHMGTYSPIIITFSAYPVSHTINIFLRNLGLSTNSVSDMTKRHEGAHALSQIAHGDIDLDQEAANNEGFGYITSVPEAITYAHGDLPAFEDAIRNSIHNVVQSKNFQEAIRNWSVSRVLSSENATLEGFMTSEQMRARAEYLRDRFGNSAKDFIEKRIRRQEGQILRTLSQMRSENRVRNIRRIDQQISATQEQIDAANNLEEHPGLFRDIRFMSQRREMIEKGMYDVDVDDVVDALARGYMGEYFSNLARGEVPAEEVREWTDFVVDSSGLGSPPGQPRPLTSEYLPFSTTPSTPEPYRPPEERIASIIRRMVRLSSRMDSKRHHRIADAIDATVRLAMPPFGYHRTDPDKIDKIMSEGFRGEIPPEQFEEHFNTFLGDLSPDGRRRFDQEALELGYSEDEVEMEFAESVETPRCPDRHLG
jgi:hypothetical protein